MKLPGLKLGRDFWLFRSGQAVSVIGDGCTSIALAWWILDSTGSAGKLASVLSPAMFAAILMIPLFGPLGDRFERKKILIISDLWRAGLMLSLAVMAYLKYFNLPVIIGLYLLVSLGSASFFSVAASIVPQLVKKEQLQEAIAHGRAVMSAGRLLGGAIGGILVSVLGVSGAFLVDGLSFLLAAGAAYLIKADTKPPAVISEAKGKIERWLKDLKAGFYALIRIPVRLRLLVLETAINFTSAPIIIALPVLVKQERNMPAWFLGGLEAGISAGAIVGALIAGYACRKIYPDIVSTAGLALFSLGLAILPLAPDLLLPLVITFICGVSLALGNIPIQTQALIATPDEYRSRIDSLASFIGHCSQPIGMAFAAWLISGIGVNKTIMLAGGACFVLCPLAYAVPDFKLLLRLPAGEADGFFMKKYPAAFAKRG